MAGTGLRDADSFYVEDCRQVQTNTHTIQNLTGQISRLVGTLEAEKDLKHCRKMVDDAVRLATETRAVLMRIREHQHQAQNPAEKNNRRMMYNKLSDNLSITARVLEDVVRRFTMEERKRAAGLDDAADRIAASGGDAAGGDDQQPLISMDRSSGSGETAEDSMVDPQQCRRQALQGVDEDMRSLQRIYTDLAAAAEDHQARFDHLESHMVSSAADLEQGRDEILLSKYGWAQRMKRRALFAAGAAAAIFVVSSLFAAS